MTAIFITFVNTCWFLFRRLLILAIVVAAALGAYFYLRMDDEIRRFAERQLAAHYTDLDVKVGGAQFDSGRGVVLHNVVLSNRDNDGGTSPLLKIDQLQMLGNFDAERLATGTPEIKKIVFVRPKIWVTRSRSGEWNLAQLIPPPSPPVGQSPAEIRIEGATVVFAQSTGNKSPLLIEGINASATRQSVSPETSTMQIAIEQHSPMCDSASANLDIDLKSGRVEGSGQIASLRIHNDLLEQLGVEPARLDGIAASGLADLVVEFAGGVDQGIDWRASYHLSAGRIACDQLPRVLSQISVRGTATPQQLMVQRASALFGKSRIDAALHAIDWQANGQFAVQAKAQQLVVDHNLRELLPQSVRCLWDRFRPEGEVNLAAAFRLDSLGLAPQQVVVECKNASFEDAEKFPYRVERAAGQLVYTAAGDEGRLEISLEGLAANQPVSLRGELSGLPSGCNFIGESKSPAPPRGMPPGWISIDCPRIPIHKRLLDALPSRSQATVQSLDPHGEISVAWRVERVAGSAVIDTSTDIELHNCSVRYSKFPYPLSGMTGHLHERNGEWTIENVESRANAQGAVVQWQGTCKTHDDQLLVRLEVAGTNMPLDDQLRVAMPERLQPLWSQFRPAGRVNFRANVVFASDHPEPVISLAVRPSERSVSIRPAFFDYSLEQIDGIVTLHQGVVTLRDMRATHGSTSISTNGTWRANDRAGWRLDLTKLSVDRLTPSRDLVSAAPQGIRQIIEQINPEGGFAIHDGTLMFEQPSQGSTQFVSQWDLKLDCHQSHFDVGVKLENVSGMVRLAGRSDQAGSYSDGQLMLDSAFWQGIQVTNIRGPLRAERNRTLLGQGAGKVTGQTPRRIEADLSGGKLALDAVVWHDGRTRYNVASSMTGVDLKRLMHEQLEASTDVSGKLQAELTLGGVGSSLDLLQGSGTVKVTEAQIYELPVFVSLLKVLRNRTPDTTAFDACEAAFTITGQQIEFSQLNLMGDAVSLYGRGQASFDHDIDLVFHSIMGRHDWNVPMLRSVLGTASQQILQIEVDGTLEQPITHRRALPAVSSLIEHLGGDGLNPSNPEHAAKRDAKGAMQR